jgi:hypothetical protein
MTMPEAATAATLDETMLVTDVVDTLRHGVDMPIDTRTAEADPALLARLREIYRQQGIEVPESVLRAGIAAMADARFAYVPPRGPAAALARLYVSRHRWGPAALAITLALVIGLGGYFFGYRPYRAAQAEQARLELAEGLPAKMDTLYQAIYNETKVQSAAADAADLRDRGKDAAARSDRRGAEQAIADLEALRDKLEQAYSLRVVNRADVKPGFWTFPPNNSEATNYYLVVEALDPDGKVLSLPITSEDNGLTETVNHWGLRVPQSVYAAVMADREDDGTIQHDLVGIKQEGFVDVDYIVPVLGGTLARW